MANVPTDRRAGFATGLALLIPITLPAMAIVLLAPILPLLIREFGNEPGAAYLVPMILALPALCLVVLSPVAGILGDCFGRRRLLLASLASIGVPLGTLISRMPVRRRLTIEFGILSVAFLLMSSANSMPAFLAGCAINQIGAGMILPTLLVRAMAQLAYEVRARGTGIWQAAFARTHPPLVRV